MSAFSFYCAPSFIFVSSLSLFVCCLAGHFKQSEATKVLFDATCSGNIALARECLAKGANIDGYKDSVR